MKLDLKKILIFLIVIVAIIAPKISFAGERSYCFQIATTDNEIIDAGKTDQRDFSKAQCFKTMEECTEARNDVARGLIPFLRWMWYRTGNQNIIDDKYVGQCALSGTGADDVNLQPETEKIGSAPSTCSLSWNFSLGACMKVGAAWSASMFLWLMGWVLTLAGQIFNMSIKISILNFADLANSQAVKLIWGLGRDLSNIFFIFILLYIAISIIIGKSKGDAQKLVVNIIITALLINFSMILPRVVIDIGNSLANVFYQNMGPTGSFGAPDIASVVVKGFKPQQFFQGEISAVGQGSADSSWRAAEKLDWSAIVLKSIGTAILIIILSYALFVASYLFIARTVVLVFLLATSSIAFFSRISPVGKLNYWDKWSSTLTKEVFFAPIFLFVFYLVLLIANEPIPGITSAPKPIGATTPPAAILSTAAVGTAGAAANGGGGVAMQVAWYVILCGLAIGSLILARASSSWSAKVAKTLTKKAGQYGGGWAARNIAGRALKAASESKAVNAITSRAPLVGGGIKGLLTKGANVKMGGKSFADQQSASASRAKELMKGMSDEQKRRFIEKTTAPRIGNLGLGGKFWMGDKEVNKLHAEQVKDTKDRTLQLKSIMSITDDKQRNKVLKEVGHGSVARMLMEAQATTGPDGVAAQDAIKKYRDSMEVEDRQKLDDIIKKEGDRVKSEERKKEPSEWVKKLADPAQAAAAIADAQRIIQSMAPSEIGGFIEENPQFYAANTEMLRHLSAAQLGGILKNERIPLRARQDIAAELNEQYSDAFGAGGVTSEMENKRKWLERHPEFA